MDTDCVYRGRLRRRPHRILQGGGEEGDASGLAGEGFEGVAGVALVAAKEQSDGVDDGALHVLNAMDGLVE